MHGTGKMKIPKKIGQRPCLESQRALLMLNGAKQKQVEGLPELPLSDAYKPTMFCFQSTALFLTHFLNFMVM